MWEGFYTLRLGGEWWLKSGCSYFVSLVETTKDTKTPPTKITGFETDMLRAPFGASLGLNMVSDHICPATFQCSGLRFFEPDALRRTQRSRSCFWACALG